MDQNELTYRVERMSCNSCRLLITEELEDVAGVDSVAVDLDDKRVTVRGNDLDDSRIRSLLAEIGYEAAATS
ncbi:MAG: heavy-metal-associated domain-containing protein [Thermoleophilia bacterium]|jgi:copper chaperone CopZ|nr:heavy-metal-associated domain-containing protein [Thermoleophilia bacterium]